MIDPRTKEDDLTAKARIRNAALDLYAEHGEGRVSMRAVAAAAGVTVGLVQHHFKTKDGLRAVVEQLVVDYYAQAIARAPDEGTPTQITAARNSAVRQMLGAHPEVMDYLRRSVLEPGGASQLLERLTELSRSEVAKLRASGVASKHRPESTQVIGMMVSQFGQSLLQPMIDDMWDYLVKTGAQDGDKPSLTVTVD